MKAAYFGTFEPFQNYHLDIIKKASRLFDTVDVAITINSQNRNNYNFIDCKHIIKISLKKKALQIVKLIVHTR
ncbi:MAG: adenylyltransferase/cytidyltransferase family protein [Bacillota bacterium]|nr:adenylyltransferase/cytidyltransferase family protein [Bacillota bacterium]